MNNKSLRSVLTFLAVFPILMMLMSALAQAPGQDLKPNIEPHDKGGTQGAHDDTGHRIKLNIEPHETKVNSAPEYHATIEAKSAPSGGFFFLNLTIPKGYNFIMPAHGNQVAKYTWFNHTNDSKVIVYIISNSTNTVDVRFSTNSGHTFITRRGLFLTNIVIGTASLKFIVPDGIHFGYINISLGGTAGPILQHEHAQVELSKDTLKSPSKADKYTWTIEAKNNLMPGSTAFTASDVVTVKK